MNNFVLRLAQELNIPVVGKSEDQIESAIMTKVMKLIYIERVAETDRRIADQTSGMSDRERQQYFDSWAGGGS